MSKKRKKDMDIILSCVGSSRDDVTGSCWTVSYPKDNGERGLVVLECGLSQGEQDVLKSYNDNIGLEVVQNCGYVLLSHPHVTSRPYRKS